MHPETKSTWRASPSAFALEDCSQCHGTGWRLFSISGCSRAQRCSCRDVTRLTTLKDFLEIPQRYEHCSLENFTPGNLSQIRALNEARKFVERYPSVSRGMMITGTPGTGKTHLAAAILRELAFRSREGLLFVDFESALPSRTGFFGAMETRRHFEARLQQISLLVVDNFGSGSLTTNDLRFVQVLLSARLERRRLTIFTGGPVRCRELFKGSAAPRGSSAQQLLSALHPALLMQLLSSIKLLAVAGEDHRRFASPLFP
jgi:DNA replication protein DnaC